MSDPVLTERVKLAAAALNTLATASITVGVIAPVAAFLYGLSVPSVPLAQIVLGSLTWVSLAGGFHYGAQRLLGRLPS